MCKQFRVEVNVLRIRETRPSLKVIALSADAWLCFARRLAAAKPVTVGVGCTGTAAGRSYVSYGAQLPAVLRNACSSGRDHLIIRFCGRAEIPCVLTAGEWMLFRAGRRECWARQLGNGFCFSRCPESVSTISRHTAAPKRSRRCIGNCSALEPCCEPISPH